MSLSNSSDRDLRRARMDLCPERWAASLTVNLVVTALRAAGRVTGFLGVATDITERRQTQTELLQAKEAAKRRPGPGAIPGEHEPRDPHADEWHPGHDDPAA